MYARAPLAQNRRRAQVSRPATIPAPVGGWDAASPLAAMPKENAVQLKNWFPQPGWVEMRKGYDWHVWDLGSNAQEIAGVDTTNNEIDLTAHGFADGTRVRVYSTGSVPGGLNASRTYYVVGAGADSFSLAKTEAGSEIDLTSAGSGDIVVYAVADDEPVESLMVWEGPASARMFAAAGNTIWDATAAGAGVPSLLGLGSNRWQHVNFTNSGATYLYLVNGTDDPKHYNGSVWATPTITGITPSDAIGINVHKKRIWFVLAQSTSAAYLPVDAIQGTASPFELGSTFTKGGYLMAMATWTRDGGSGPDDYAVFVSSRGQVALYQGTDPDEAETWSLVGVFDVPRPIGRRCFHKYGADVLLITVEGVFPLSQLLSVDKSQAKRVAITENIQNALNTFASNYSANVGWELCVYSKGTRLFLNVPTVEGSRAVQAVMNTLTGAWCEYDNHNACAWAVFNDNVYFGGANGGVYQADIGSADIDQPIVGIGQCAYQAFSGPGTMKHFKMLKPLVTSTGGLRPSLGVSTDFVETSELSTVTAEASGGGSSQWDVAKWDAFKWAGEAAQINDWVSAPALGTFASIKFQATTGLQSGRSGWGISRWGISLWGGSGSQSQTMRINGFVGLYEIGGVL